MKKWTQEEILTMLEYIENGNKTYEEIGKILNRSGDSIRGKLNKLHKKISSFKIKEEINCLECNKLINNLTYKNRKFCSNSCSATFNNKKRVKKENNIKRCLNCNEIVDRRNKYCNNKCQCQYEKNELFKKIENGDSSLYEGHYKKYLIEKYGEKCMECNWNRIHPITGKVPIQMEHINGNSSDNTLSNLKLLCPNCHSLTPTFGALNKGNGRKNRKR